MENSGANNIELKMVDQVSYAVKDIDEVVEAWSSMYGMGPWTYAENGGLDAKGRPWKIMMAFAYVGPVQIELVQCTEGRIFQSRFIDTWGEGLHHIGFYVDDLDAAVADLVAKEARLFIHDPGNFAYLNAGGPGGALFELMQRPS